MTEKCSFGAWLVFPMVKGLWVQFPVKDLYLVCRFTPHPSLDASVRHTVCVSLALMLPSEKSNGGGVRGSSGEDNKNVHEN